MHRNIYLLLFCIVILGAISFSEYKEIKGSDGQAQITDPASFTANAQQALSMDENILLTEDAPIMAVEATSTPTVVAADSQPVKKPYITAESYLVGNLETGEVYIKSNPEKVYPIASVSKLYTALVVHHLFDLEQKITITPSMLEAYGNAGDLSVDEKFTPDELMYALLLESSNDAAEAYAQSFGYDNFMEQMNAFAKEIGMSKTSFKDASGLSPRNISNANDLFVLAKYLYTSEQDILNISRTPQITLQETPDHKEHFFRNINPYATNADFIGGKTGRTNEAKESMVSLFEQTINGVRKPIVIIVLRSDFGDRENNTERLLNMFLEEQSSN